MASAAILRLLPLAAALGGCGALETMPKDPRGTTERIAASHVLRAGAAENPPWVVTRGGGEPQGPEPDMVRAFARELGAKVAWTVNGEAPLAEALEKRELDLAVTGATIDTPWKKRVAVTQSYATGPGGKKRVLLAAAGENRLLLRLDRFLLARKRAVRP